MTQFSLPPCPWPAGSQKQRIYRRLAAYGRVRNVEILLGLGGPRIMNTTGRCSEIRSYLQPHGIDLHCHPVNDSGVYEYRIEGEL